MIAGGRLGYAPVYAPDLQIGFRELQHDVFLGFLSRGQLLTLPVLADYNE